MFGMFGAGIAHLHNLRERNQEEVRPERVFRQRLDLLAISDNYLLRYYRFPRHVIVELSEVLEPALAQYTLIARLACQCQWGKQKRDGSGCLNSALFILIG